MAQVVLDIKTNADLAAFQKLDAAEQQTVLQAMKLQKEMKQAEAATAAWANAAAQANAKVARSASEADRLQQQIEARRKANQGAMRSRELSLPQDRRQMLRQLEQQGPQQYSAYTAAVVAQSDAVIANRTAEAAALWRLRRERRYVVQNAQRLDSVKTGSELIRRNDADREAYRRHRDRLAIENQSAGDPASLTADATAADVARRSTDRTARRHGQQAVFSQTHRQILAQITQSGQDPTSDYARELVANAQAALAFRNDLARRIKALRQTDRAAAERLRTEATAERAGFDALADRRRDFSADPFERRARRELTPVGPAHRPGSLGAATLEADIEERAAVLARRNDRRETAAGFGLSGVMAAIAGVSAITQAGNQIRGDALSRVTDSGNSRRELKQIADNGADYRKMIGLAGTLGTTVGMSGDEAFKTVFAGKSAGLLDGDFVKAITSSKRMNLDPQVALQAVQKVRGNWQGAGTTSEILGKLLIAAGPSPANVTELAGGVGTVASPMNAIGGSAEESLAALGVLSGPNKNVEGTAERIKSLADQLNKKRNRIVFDGAPMRGLELMQALPKLAAAGRLRGEDGKAANVEDFLGEQQAVAGMRDLIQNRDAIAAQVKQMKGANVGTLAADQAAAYDPTTTALDIADRNKRKREFAEETRFAQDEAVANAVDEAHKAYLLQSGSGSTKMALNTALNWVSRSSPVGVDARSHSMSELYYGNVHDDETRRVVADSLLRGRSSEDLTKFRGEITAGRGKVMDRALLGGVDPHGMAFVRDMEANEAPTFLAAIDGRLKQLQEDATGGGSGGTVGGRFAPFMNTLAAVAGKLGPGLARVGGAAGQVAGSVDAFAQSSGLAPNDYRVKIFENVVKKRGGAAAIGTLLGGDPDKINAGLAGEADQKTYEANLKIIADAQTAADKDLAGATKGTAAYDRASARSKGLKGLVRGAKASGGRVDVFEAQSIVDQISGTNGDEAFKKSMVDLITKAVAGLEKTSAGIDKLVAAQPTPNTTPQDKKNPLNAPPKPRGTRTVN